MRVDFKEQRHGPFRVNLLQMVTPGTGHPPEMQSRIQDTSLADRQAEIGQLVGELGGALGGERSEQWQTAGNALMGKVSEYLSKGGSFSPDQSADLIDQMVSIFHLKMDTLQQEIKIDFFHSTLDTLRQEIEIKAEKERSAVLALQALNTALLLYLRSDPKPEGVGWMLGALQGAIERMADMWTSSALADMESNEAASYALEAMLRDFAECVPSLPQDDLAGVVGPMVALFHQYMREGSSGFAPALQALRTALLLLRHTKQEIPQFIPDALNAVAQLELEELAFENKAALIRILAEFGKEILTEGLSSRAHNAFAEVAIDVMNGNGDLGLKAFRVLCAFAQREPDVAMQLFLELFAKAPDAAVQVFPQLLESNPDVATKAFSQLLAYKPDVAMQAFSQALDMFGKLDGKLAAINGGESQDGEAKLEAYDEAMQLFEGYASTLAVCIGQVPAGLRGSFIGQIKGEFDVADRQMQADGSDEQRFAGMKVAHELLKLWGLLLVPPGSIDMVLDAVVTALNENGKYYFSCRGDDEWRRIHTKDPEVYGILARTDLALITGKVVELAEMTADTVMALGTVLRRASAGVGARTCDSYTQVVCSVLGEVQNVTARVIAEMQQKLRMTGGRDNLMERIEEYIALARKGLGAGAQVFGIGYQGYGKRGTLVRNEHGNAATFAIGAPIAFERKPLTPEESLALVERFRAAIRGGLPVQQTPMATRSCRMGRPRIDDAVIDVITVIGTSHILTPAIIENLRLHQDARVLCTFLQITKESMIKRLDENDRQASLMLGEGLVKSPEGTRDREFAEASGAFTGNVVAKCEGLFKNVFLLRSRLAEEREARLAAEAQLAERDEQLAAAEAQLAEEKARAAELEKQVLELEKSACAAK